MQGEYDVPLCGTGGSLICHLTAMEYGVESCDPHSGYNFTSDPAKIGPHEPQMYLRQFGPIKQG